MFDRICIYQTLFTKARRNKYDFSRFQYFLLGFSTLDDLPSALAPFFFLLIPVSLFIQLLSEERPEVTSVPLRLQLGFQRNGDKSIWRVGVILGQRESGDHLRSSCAAKGDDGRLRPSSTGLVPLCRSIRQQKDKNAAETVGKWVQIN